MATNTSVHLVNESAMGIYVFSWGPHGKRCEMSWYEGLDTPMLSFYVAARGRMSPAIPVRDPGRFGTWPLPAGHKRAMPAFRAIVTAFAEAHERGEG